MKPTTQARRSKAEELEKEAIRAAENATFWEEALVRFELVASALTNGRPVTEATSGVDEVKTRRLYEGSAAYRVVHLLHEGDGLSYDDVIEEMLESEWAAATKDPLGAIARAMRKLVGREYIEEDLQFWYATEAGLDAAQITKSDAPAEAEASTPSRKGGNDNATAVND